MAVDVVGGGGGGVVSKVDLIAGCYSVLGHSLAIRALKVHNLA